MGSPYGFATLPGRNSNSDVPGKYSNAYFRISRNGYDPSGTTLWAEEIKAAYEDDIKSIFAVNGWKIFESEESYSSATAAKGKSNLYLHPQNFSGVCENAERERLFRSLQNATTFKCTMVDVYAEIFDMSDEQLANLLESKREAIEAELLEAFATKRRNLYITDVGFFGIDGKIAKSHSIRRLAIDGKKSFGGQDECTDGICYTFVSGIFEGLVSCGKIVTAKTKKNGIGYRTAKKGDFQ